MSLCIFGFEDADKIDDNDAVTKNAKLDETVSNIQPEYSIEHFCFKDQIIEDVRFIFFLKLINKN